MPDTTVAESLTPMTPHAVTAAFDHLRAVQAGALEVAAALAAAEPRTSAILVDVATRIVAPVTALPGPDMDAACADTFALEALGHVFLSALRTWEQAGPDAAEGIARTVIRFTADVLTEDHEDILRQLHAAALRQALDAHPTLAGAHPIRPGIVQNAGASPAGCGGVKARWVVHTTGWPAGLVAPGEPLHRLSRCASTVM
ncbi:hypothetical protein ACIBCB_19910 [Streptomyces uncialis]|uniref:hypothetical protein n=1 Tax=Streptomyces uncialis TaxID=1048205 RepID=UPI0037B694EB